MGVSQDYRYPSKGSEEAKIRGTILGLPIVRIMVFGGLHWDPHIYGNYHLLVAKVGDKGI